MYPISSAVKTMLDNNYRQVIDIVMDTTDGDSYKITESDIISGSFSIDRYSITGSRIELGTAAAAELSFRIKNYEGEWDDVTFEAAQLFVKIGVADWNNYEDENDIQWIPCGYFKVDKPVKTSHIMQIEALDRMAYFDKPVDWTKVTGSFNPRTLIDRVCTVCGVLVANGSSMNSLPNASYQVTLPTDKDLTYRNLIQSACMLMGVCAVINYDGQLEVKWYSAPSMAITIDESKRYSHEMNENDISITGIYYAVKNDSDELVEYLAGTKDYAIDISDNPLIGSNPNTVVSALGSARIGFTYRPLSASIKPSPYLWPLDMITFKKGETSYTGIVSNVTCGLNATTVIEGKGESNEENNYATYGNFTAVQSKIVDYARSMVRTEISGAEAMMLNMNEMIANSLGLYVIEQSVSGGGKQYYFCDKSTLASSSIIYTFTANGLAWTTNWNSGSPVWQYGITRDGNAVLNMLSVYKLNADVITTGKIKSKNNMVYFDLDNNELACSKLTNNANYSLGNITIITGQQNTGSFTEGMADIQNSTLTSGSIKMKPGNSRDSRAVIAGGGTLGLCLKAGDISTGSGASVVPQIRIDSESIWLTTRPNGTGASLSLTGTSVTAAQTLYTTNFNMTGTFTYKGSIVNPSDRRLKKNIKPIVQKYLDAIGSVCLQQFEYKDQDGLRFGAVAQDVMEAFEQEELNWEDSSIVGKSKMKDDTEEFYGLNYIEFLLIRVAHDEQVMQEQQKEIETLKSSVEKLTERLEALEERMRKEE